jgi:hypothetical protein
VSEGVIAVEVAEKPIPVVDGGRGPDRVSGGALGGGELELEGTGGAGVGGNDGGAAPERGRDGWGEAPEGLQIEV